MHFFLLNFEMCTNFDASWQRVKMQKVIQKNLFLKKGTNCKRIFLNEKLFFNGFLKIFGVQI